jgi:hypothetical protein
MENCGVVWYGYTICQPVGRIPLPSEKYSVIFGKSFIHISEPILQDDVYRDKVANLVPSLA